MALAFPFAALCTSVLIIIELAMNHRQLREEASRQAEQQTNYVELCYEAEQEGFMASAA